MVIISLELTKVNPDRNIFSINVEQTSTLFTLQRLGLSPSLNFKKVFTSEYSRGVTLIRKTVKRFG